jgi:regulator of sigma E protease
MDFMLSSFGSILLLVFGFGFVIFFHELGHFLAAKWADVKVEQFAVGFGQALFSWRKGLGFRWGSSAPEYESLVKIEQEGVERANVHAISETEYRLNWIPLGGYVKMLGQDDLKPGASVNDPRAYNNKSVGQRMVIVSAGVIMNVILAAIGFMAIFLMGFAAPPAVVGAVLPDSPAQHTYRYVNGQKQDAPLQVGDRILYLNEKWQSDFTKIQLNVALMSEGSVPVLVKRVDGTDDHLFISPDKPGGDFKDIAAIGIMPAYELRAPDVELDQSDLSLLGPDARLLNKGDTIKAIEGQSVTPDEFWKLDEALQKSRGEALTLAVADKAGQTRDITVHPYFLERFDGDPVNFAGLTMRTAVQSVQDDSPAKGVILPGDVIVSVEDPNPSGDRLLNPTADELKATLSQAGQKGIALNITVLRDGKEVPLKNVVPSKKLPGDPPRYGIGILLGYDQANPVVAGTLKNSAAKAADIPAGATITSLDGHPVHTWFDVNAILAGVTPGKSVSLTATVDGKQERTFTLGPISQEASDQVRANRFSCALELQAATFLRKTGNPLVAAGWGVGETRDAILNVYQTVRAMVNQRVSYKQVSGPVGIFAAGYRFAEMGVTRLIWFLAIISANLAVMNFLPIPIVDGGLFTFLIIEKLQGGPVSPRVQAIAQVVGLAILLSVFLLATYQDITRLPFMTR